MRHDDLIYGGAGNDSERYGAAFLAMTRFMVGLAADFGLDGGLGDDLIYGGAGNDADLGGSGSSVLGMPMSLTAVLAADTLGPQWFGR